MGMDTKAVGGGAATGVSKDFLNILRQGIAGMFGAGTDPNSVMGALGNLLGGDMSAQGDSIRSIQERQKTEDLARLKAQFGMNTSSLGTPNQVASSRYLSERSPQDVLQLEDILTKNRMNALSLLMPMFSQAIGLGTPQRQIVQTPSAGMNALNAFSTIGNTVSNFLPTPKASASPVGSSYQTTGDVAPYSGIG